MKIGIVGTRGIPNQYGGFEQFAEFVSPELVRRGHEVYVYNSSQHPFKEKEWKGVKIVSRLILKIKLEPLVSLSMILIASSMPVKKNLMLYYN
jgi:hypothetical protein